MSVVPAGITTGVGDGAGDGGVGVAGLEFEVELVLSGEVLDVPGAALDVADVSDGVLEWLQPPKISSRLATRHCVTIRFSMRPPFAVAGLIEGFLVSMKRYSYGLSDRLKSGWMDDVKIRYSSSGA